MWLIIIIFAQGFQEVLNDVQNREKKIQIHYSHINVIRNKIKHYVSDIIPEVKK